jgi:hypothetical protein
LVLTIGFILDEAFAAGITGNFGLKFLFFPGFTLKQP